MVQMEKLDIRTITLGISLRDCAHQELKQVARRMYDKVCRRAEKLVAVGSQLAAEYGVPIVNQRISVTPVAMVAEAFTRAGVAHTVQRAGNQFSVFFRGEAVVDYAQAQQQDTGAFAAFHASMLDNGVSLPPSAFEAWFVSSAHDDRALQRIADALPAAAQAAARAQEVPA